MCELVKQFRDTIYLTRDTGRCGSLPGLSRRILDSWSAIWPSSSGRAVPRTCPRNREGERKKDGGSSRYVLFTCMMNQKDWSYDRRFFTHDDLEVPLEWLRLWVQRDRNDNYTGARKYVDEDCALWMHFWLILLVNRRVAAGEPYFQIDAFFLKCKHLHISRNLICTVIVNPMHRQTQMWV